MALYKFVCCYYYQIGYIYSAIKGHRNAMFMAAVQSLDGTKPKTNHNPNTNLTVILIHYDNTNPIP